MAKKKRAAAPPAAKVPPLDQALATLQRLPPDAPERRDALARLADAAVADGPAVKPRLPEELHAEFDLTLQATAQVEAGQDDTARETLQTISLRSPFLEWKLFLRGLSAYYQNDDARALENWQRLSPTRLPARLAAPFRFALDPAFRAAQPPEAQNALRPLADQVQGSDLIQKLRAVQAALADTESLARAFRLAEGVVVALKAQAPHLVPRLATCFYWAIIEHGDADDEPRYLRVFGPPPEDHAFHRLRALAMERRGGIADAHHHWREYERWVAEHPFVWPNGQATLVRALIWKHMGLNAAAYPDFDNLDLPPFLRNHPDRPQSLKPTAEQCFRRSLELLPDQLDTRDELVQLYLRKEEPKKAEAEARALLERYPEHVPTLQRLARLCVQAQKFTEATAFQERALRANPLDRELREELATIHLFQARSFVEEGRFDDARAAFNTAQALSSRDAASIWCKRAACEFKAGDAAKAEEYIARARRASDGTNLGVAYSMLIEVIRLKLPGKLKTRFNKEFNEGLAAPPDGASAAAVVGLAASHKAAGVTYHGQKTHEKKVLDYLKKAARASFTEEQLSEVCQALLTLNAARTLTRTYTEKGRHEYPLNPNFILWELDLAKVDVYGMNLFRMRQLVEQARRLVAEMPPGAEKDKLQQRVRAFEDVVAIGLPFGNFGGFLEALEGMFGDEDEADEDDWDD